MRNFRCSRLLPGPNSSIHADSLPRKDLALPNGNRKRQPEAAIEAASRSGRKQEMKKIFHGGGD
jgi:hypothetical protein